MTNSSKTCLGLESLKCLSHPQISPTFSFVCVSGLHHQVTTPATQFYPEETTAQLVLSNQQLPAYLTRTALWGKVPLPEISSPFHSGKQIGSGKVVCAEQDYKENREAAVGRGREKGIKVEGEMIRRSN